MAFDETIRGVHTIAAPVHIGPSEVAALSVSGPSSRFGEDLMEAAAGPLAEAAAQISAAMGFGTPVAAEAEPVGVAAEFHRAVEPGDAVQVRR